MDYKTYEGIRWKLIYGKYDGVEKFAINELYKIVQQYVPYTLTISDSANINIEEAADYNLLFIGTSKSCSFINNFAKEDIIKLNERKEGYIIKVCNSIYNPERKMIILAGADENGTLYAVRDFEHHYVDQVRYKGYHYNSIYKPFIDEMPDYEASSSPAIENRGLWTWGHVIYDYRRYLDNMSKWKMNTVIMWNDYAPLNAKDIVEYAHSRGIKVIWGFSWCWGEKVNPTDKDELEKWTKRVINTYEEQYKHLGGDGIYFQAFTETNDTAIEGESIARLVTNWVNHISERLLERHPELWLLFGIHATSIKDEYLELSKLDPRVAIMWEDAGSFPYAYDPRINDKFEETIEYTDRISELRREKEDFGAVLKGFTVLNWTRFEHQKGIFILGESSPHFVKKKKAEKEFYWKFCQPYWNQNIDKLQEFVKQIDNKDIKRKTVTALVEDGAWEAETWYPVALLAEVLWNPYADSSELITRISNSQDAVLI